MGEQRLRLLRLEATGRSPARIQRPAGRAPVHVLLSRCRFLPPPSLFRWLPLEEFRSGGQLQGFRLALRDAVTPAPSNNQRSRAWHHVIDPPPPPRSPLIGPRSQLFPRLSVTANEQPPAEPRDGRWPRTGGRLLIKRPPLHFNGHGAPIKSQRVKKLFPEAVRKESRVRNSFLPLTRNLNLSRGRQLPPLCRPAQLTWICVAMNSRRPEGTFSNRRSASPVLLCVYIFLNVGHQSGSSRPDGPPASPEVFER